MTIEEAHEFFARRAAALLSRDVQAIATDYAEDCVVESPSGTTIGRAALVAHYRKLFAVASDLAFEVDDLVVMGDQVVLTGTLNGTATAFPGLESGKRFSLPVVSLYTMRDGQITRLRRVHDFSAIVLQRVERELKSAAEVQQALLPQGRYAGAGFEAVAASVPCRAIGGDFFDYFDGPDQGFSFVLGDVAGKGPPAALLSATLQGILGVHDQSADGPAATLTQVNRALLRRAIPSRFATVVYGSLTKGGQLTYSNAGHNPPLLIGRRGLSWLRTGGCVVGMFDNVAFEEETLQLDPGDVLVVYSDGVTEAVSADGSEFGEDRLVSCIEAHRDVAPAVLVECILDSVHQFAAGALQSDDVTVMVVRYDPR